METEKLIYDPTLDAYISIDNITNDIKEQLNVIEALHEAVSIIRKFNYRTDVNPFEALQHLNYALNWADKIEKYLKEYNK
jgi:hypothetical protein